VSKFDHLNVPDQWNNYFTKYPQGYTILEALLSWVGQVDSMTDNVNDWNKYLDDFKAQFDTELSGTVDSLLAVWEADGTLDAIINQRILSTKADKSDLASKRNTADKIKLEDLDSTVVGAIAGNTSITLNTIPQAASVNPEKLDAQTKADLYTTSTVNMLNPYKTTSGFMDCLGVVTPNSGNYVYTEQLDVTGLSAVFFTNDTADAQARFITPFLANGTPLATTSAQFVYQVNYTVPAGVTKLVISYDKVAYPKFAIGKNKKAVPFENYYQPKAGANSKYAAQIPVYYGDSITQQNKWQPTLESKLQLGAGINKGVAGRQIAGASGMNTDAAIATLPAVGTFDLLFVMGGTNDWAQSVPLGTINDSGNTTFYGALNTMTEKLITNYPLKRIIYLTPPKGALYANSAFTSGGYVNTLGLKTDDYAAAVKEVAKKYGIPCVDVNSDAGWNKINITNFITDDGGLLHPNDTGGARIGYLVTGKLLSI
jgi:lysophospholipase L1-like esterase